MISLFNRKNKPLDIIIKIDFDKLSINDHIVNLPIDWQELKKYFGEPTEIKKNGIYWKEIGISTNPNGNGKTNHVTLHTDYDPMWARPKSEQKPYFNGTIIADGIKINKKRFDEVKMRKYELTYFAHNKANPCLITIKYNEIFDKDFVKPKLIKDKYEIKKLNEEQIEFRDFGFKLSVVQELMYNKELLEPKFDLFEFVEWFDKRKIDIEKEGYEPIPEVTQYFKDLPIPKKFASELTEIYQDGGNDIYMQLLRFGEGYENYWDIENIEDVKQFPNLKKAILCYAKDTIVDQMNNFGIKAEWI